MRRTGVSTASDRLFVVRFLGQTVACEHPAHAAAVQRASDIFSGLDTTEYSPEELDQLTAVLIRYGHSKPAEVLAERATLIRHMGS